MARCWTCGAYIGPEPDYTCPTCRTIQEVQDLREEAATGFTELALLQERGFRELSHRLSEVATIIEWGFEELNWELHQQTEVLRSIDHTLKTPSATQANEWRLMGEELRRRGVLDKAEQIFSKALEANPLDYRIYVGLAKTYLQMKKFDEAKFILERSLPHAPKMGRTIAQETDVSERVLSLIRKGKLYSATVVYYRDTGTEWDEAWNYVYTIKENLTEYTPLDYKSYSHRLIGRICACKEDFDQAISNLRSAVRLSPLYTDAAYDLAQYCAQTGSEEDCFFYLEKAIKDGGSLFFYLAEKERNFEPLKREVQNLLIGIAKEAMDCAETAICEAEKELKETGKSVVTLQQIKAEIKAHTLVFLSIDEKVMLEANEECENAQSKLKLAKDKVASKDYMALLEAEDIALEASASAAYARDKADRELERLRSKLIERIDKESALSLGNILGRIIAGAFIGFVCSLIPAGIVAILGFALRILVQPIITAIILGFPIIGAIWLTYDDLIKERKILTKILTKHYESS